MIFLRRRLIQRQFTTENYSLLQKTSSVQLTTTKNEMLQELET